MMGILEDLAQPEGSHCCSWDLAKKPKDTFIVEQTQMRQCEA